MKLSMTTSKRQHHFVISEEDSRERERERDGSKGSSSSKEEESFRVISYHYSRRRICRRWRLPLPFHSWSQESLVPSDVLHSAFFRHWMHWSNLSRGMNLSFSSFRFPSLVETRVWRFLCQEKVRFLNAIFISSLQTIVSWTRFFTIYSFSRDQEVCRFSSCVPKIIEFSFVLSFFHDDILCVIPSLLPTPHYPSSLPRFYTKERDPFSCQSFNQGIECSKFARGERKTRLLTQTWWCTIKACMPRKTSRGEVHFSLRLLSEQFTAFKMGEAF